MTEQSDIATMPFEQALQELEKIVRHLESGDIPLEESITSYERGIALKKHCETKIKDAQLKIEKITTDQNNKATGVEDTQIDLANLDS